MYSMDDLDASMSNPFSFYFRQVVQSHPSLGAEQQNDKSVFASNERHIFDSNVTEIGV